MATESGGDWSAQDRIVAGSSNAGPGLAVLNGTVYAAWKGMDSDKAIYYSYLDEHSGWSPQRAIPGVRTSAGPRLAAFDGKLYAAWKSADDELMYYAAMERSFVAGSQTAIPGTGTNRGVGLATVGYGAHEVMYAAWKGYSDNDQKLYFAFMEKKSVWGGQSRLSDGRSSVAPSIACYGYGDGEVLYAAWKGAGSDQKLYFASLRKGKGWETQTELPKALSDYGPALAQYRDRLYAAWRGNDGQGSIWWASMDKSETWSPPEKVSGVGTSYEPALAVFDDKLCAVWKGVDSDTAIYHQAIVTG